jgi:hypothetical protein
LAAALSALALRREVGLIPVLVLLDDDVDVDLLDFELDDERLGRDDDLTSLLRGLIIRLMLFDTSGLLRGLIIRLMLFDTSGSNVAIIIGSFVLVRSWLGSGD